MRQWLTLTAVYGSLPFVMTDIRTDATVQFSVGDCVFAIVEGSDVRQFCWIIREDTPGRFVVLRHKPNVTYPIAFELATATNPRRFSLEDTSHFCALINSIHPSVSAVIRALAPHVR